MGRYGYAEQRKILKASTESVLLKIIKYYTKYGYVQNSEIKKFDSDRKPYQVLVVKKWLAKEKNNGSSKSNEIA